MTSLSSASVRPLSFALIRWPDSCSVLPPVINAATVIKLRSRLESSARSQTSPNRTSSRKDSLEQRFISFHALRHDDQRAIGKGGTNSFGLSSIISLSPKAAMQAVGVESFAAELAGAVGKGKRGDHSISPLDGRNHRSYFFYNSHPFMAQPPPWLIGF